MSDKVFLRISMAALLQLFVLGVVQPSVSLARWAAPAEADTAVNFRNTSYKVRKDGSFTIDYEDQIEILTEKARINEGLKRKIFNAHASKMEVLEAKTINPDRTIAVDPAHIEIKPLASSGPGFDLSNQLTIAYPDVRVGSRLYFRYRRTVSEPEIPGFFSYHEPLGWNELLQKMRIHVESELPLQLESHDPGHVLKMPGVGGDLLNPPEKAALYTADIELATPVFRQVFEEENSRIDSREFAWLGISTAKTWDQFPGETLASYETVLGSPLPVVFEKIRAKAAPLSDARDQVAAVTSALQEAVRYVGDWIPVSGAYHPRTLDMITKTGFGDCKDFTVSAGAILKRLGYEVHAAWVVRGTGYDFPPTRLPGKHFNHAILYAKKDGREHWIDPTNPISYPAGIYADIADRPVLLLKPGRIELQRTPAMDASQGASLMSYHLQFPPRAGQNPLIEVDGKFSLLGRNAISMTGTSLSYSKAQLNFTLVSWLANVGRLDSWSFGDYDLSSRIVRDLAVPFHFTERWNPLQSSAGEGYLLQPPPASYKFNFNPAQRVSDLQLDEPGKASREYRFSGRRAVLPRTIQCSGKSPWMDFSREFSIRDGEVVFHEEILTKKSFIPIAEIRSSEFAKLKAGVSRCLQEGAVVFR